MEDISYAEFACSEVWGGNGRIHKGVRLPGLEGAVLSEPCQSGRGGDVYYVSACSSGIYSRVYLADVAGHGEEVAELSSWFHGVLRRRINHHDTGKVFCYVNREVIHRGFRAFTTAACFTYNAHRGELNFSYAGHPAILRYSARQQRWAPLVIPASDMGVRNAAFGATERAVYDVGRIKVEPGDHLLMYSDGLTETPDARRILFGEERLLDCLARSESNGECGALLNRLMDALCQHAGKSSLDHDDVTVMAFTVQDPVQGFLPLVAVKNRLRRRRLHREGMPPAPQPVA